MKHLLSFLSFIIAATIPLLSYATVRYTFTYTYEGQTVKYYVKNDGTCSTAKCEWGETAHNIKGKLILPAYPKNGSTEYKLTTIGESSFYENDELEYVEIPNTVTTIENHVFQGCDQLSTVILPNSLTLMYSGVFRDCINLKSISLPESLEMITTSTFMGCTNLESIEIPSKVTKIGSWAFEGCKSLTTIIIPNSVKTIETEAFKDCSGLESVIIGSSVTSLEEKVFSGCHPMKFAYPNTLSKNPFGDFGSNAATLGAYNPDGAIFEDGWIYGPDKKEIRFAPYDLEGDYVLPDSIQSIGPSAFLNCKKITSLTFPNSLQIIDDFAFYNCIGIDSCSLFIPRSVFEIGKRAFYNCSFINIILGRTLSDGPYRINKQSFNGCQYKKYAYAYGIENPFIAPHYPDFGSYDSDGAIIENGWIFGPDKKEIRYAPYELEGEYVIPETVTSIGEHAFSRCPKLTKVIGTDSITSVGKYTFYASGITSIELPSVKYIGMGAFNSCSVKSVSLGWGITHILDETFANSKLTYLDIPNSVTTIYESAFAHCSNLTSILIPNSVTKIGEKAFSGTGLKSVVIPNSINTLSEGVFESCNSLSEIVIGNGMEDIYFPGGLPESIADLYITSTTSPKLWDSNYHPGWNWGKLYIPKNSEESYQTASWDRFREKEFLVDASGLSLNASSIKGKVGETFQLSAVVEPSNVTLPYVFWKSTNPEIAIVDNHGLVTLVKDVLDANHDSDGINKCKIICETLYPGVSAVVYIGDPDITHPQSIEWQQDFNDITVGDSKELSATATSGLPVEYTSSDTNLATIENGIVTFLSPGTVTLTARQAGDEKYLPAQPVEISVDIKPESVKELYLDYSEIEMYVRASFQFNVSWQPEGATKPELEWSSDDPEIAIIDENGLLTALKEGSTKIFVMLSSDHEVISTCNVIIKKMPQSIEWYQDFNDVFVGDSKELSATAASGLPIEYVSSNPTIAEINGNTVYFINAGDVSIIALQNGSDTFEAASPIVKSMSVKTRTITVESIEINESSLTLEVNKSYPLEVTIVPDNATDKTVIWNSSDLEVATVDETGQVIAVKPGTAIITATAANGLTVTCEVTVLPTLVESIILTPNEIQGLVGESFTIEATVLPENASTSKIEWKSTNPTVATVNQAGYVEILKDGSCRIIANAIDGSNVSAECLITGTSGIESIFADVADHISVYTPSGMLVKKDCSSYDLKNLVPGIYVLKSETKTIKVILR